MTRPRPASSRMPPCRPQRPGRRGFSLFEMLVALAILGVLTALFGPTLVNGTNEAKASELTIFVDGGRSALCSADDGNEDAIRTHWFPDDHPGRDQRSSGSPGPQFLSGPVRGSYLYSEHVDGWLLVGVSDVDGDGEYRIVYAAACAQADIPLTVRCSRAFPEPISEYAVSLVEVAEGLAASSAGGTCY